MTDSRFYYAGVAAALRDRLAENLAGVTLLVHPPAVAPDQLRLRDEQWRRLVRYFSRFGFIEYARGGGRADLDALLREHRLLYRRFPPRDARPVEMQQQQIAP
jgi:hypothetical protein